MYAIRNKGTRRYLRSMVTSSGGYDYLLWLDPSDPEGWVHVFDEKSDALGFLNGTIQLPEWLRGDDNTIENFVPREWEVVKLISIE